MDHCHLYQHLKCCHSRNIGGSVLRDMVSVDNNLHRRFGFEGRMCKSEIKTNKQISANVAIIAACARGALSWCPRWLGCSIEPSLVAVAMQGHLLLGTYYP